MAVSRGCLAFPSHEHHANGAWGMTAPQHSVPGDSEELQPFTLCVTGRPGDSRAKCQHSSTSSNPAKPTLVVRSQIWRVGAELLFLSCFVCLFHGFYFNIRVRNEGKRHTSLKEQPQSKHWMLSLVNSQ